MDISELKQLSDRSSRIALAKRNALEQARSMMLLAYAGHLFIANAELINLVHILKQTKNKFVVLDSNDNPMMVEKPEEFLDKLIEKNQEALNTYNQMYQDSITKG